MGSPLLSQLYTTTVEQWLRAQPEPPPVSPAELADRRLFFGDRATMTLTETRAADLDDLYGYLEFLVWAEQGVVTDVCGAIACNCPYSFSADLRAGASSVKTQEAGHSRRAYQLLRQLELAEQRPATWSLPVCGHVLDRLIEEFPTHRQLAKLLLVTFAEVADFNTANRLIAQPGIAELVADFARFHELEEILHRVYFRKLLEELVLQLSEAEGLFAAYAIRVILRSFLAPSGTLEEDGARQWEVVRTGCGPAIAYLEATGFFADERRTAILKGLT